MDYQLKPIGAICAETGQELQPGDVCYSALVEKGNEWVRLDYSSKAWKGPPDGAIGYWKCTVPQRNQTRRRVLDTDDLFRHFEQLCDDANPAQDQFRYVLALLLVQRRRLRINGTRTRDDATILELGGLQGEGPYEVRDQPLDAQQIQALQHELNQRLLAEPE